jgi:hypothetical protein
VSQLSPNADMVARDLSVKLTAAPGLFDSRTFTLRDDGVSTSVACTISETATTCNSGGATATISPGSELSIRITVTGVADLADALIGWRATTP